VNVVKFSAHCIGKENNYQCESCCVIRDVTLIVECVLQFQPFEAAVGRKNVVFILSCLHLTTVPSASLSQLTATQETKIHPLAPSVAHPKDFFKLLQATGQTGVKNNSETDF